MVVHVQQVLCAQRTTAINAQGLRCGGTGNGDSAAIHGHLVVHGQVGSTQAASTSHAGIIGHSDITGHVNDTAGSYLQLILFGISLRDIQISTHAQRATGRLGHGALQRLGKRQRPPLGRHEVECAVSGCISRHHLRIAIDLGQVQRGSRGIGCRAGGIVSSVERTIVGIFLSGSIAQSQGVRQITGITGNGGILSIAPFQTKELRIAGDIQNRADGRAGVGGRAIFLVVGFPGA